MFVVAVKQKKIAMPWIKMSEALFPELDFSLCMYTHVYVCMYGLTHAVACMLRSEDNLRVFVLSLHCA